MGSARREGDRLYTDDEILVLVRAGQKESYRVIVERYEKKVYALGMSFFHNSDEARDFTQDVFIKAHGALSSFEGRSSFSTWLFRIAYNHALNCKNAHKEYLSLADEGGIESPDEASPEREVIKSAVKKAVKKAVDGLPPRFRACVDFSFFYGLKYEEIARIIEAPVNTVKSHILRAKKILREKLQGLV